MNNKEFISEMSRRVGGTVKDTNALMTALISEISEQLEDEKVVSIQGFGTFEVKKKLERVVVNPTTKQKMLVPPKLAVSFKPSVLLKEKYNEGRGE